MDTVMLPQGCHRAAMRMRLTYVMESAGRAA
jgi:hypothetical protein